LTLIGFSELFLKEKKMRANVKVGDILVHSIGFGHDTFYQIIKRTDKTVRVVKLKEKIVNRSIKFQTCDYLPIKDKFVEGDDNSFFTLKLQDNGKIGPYKRLDGWWVWDGKKQNQYCP
jgi:hypothetical protein